MMNLKHTLFTVTALGALALSAHAQMAGAPTTATPVIPGMMPGTTPGFVQPPANTLPPMGTMPATAMPGNMAMGNAMAPTTTMPGAMMPGAMVMNAQDQLFVARAAEGNLAEIALANLAISKTKNANVKQTAQIILMGHTKAQNDLAQITRAKGMMMAPMLSVTHMAVYDALKKAKGDDFDKMYMAGQTGDHENTIALFSSQVNGGVDDALKTYASQYLPDIVGHTIVIYNVAKQVKAPGSQLRPPMPPVPPGVAPALMGTPIDMTDSNTVNMSINQMVMNMSRTQPAMAR